MRKLSHRELVLEVQRHNAGQSKGSGRSTDEKIQFLVKKAECGHLDELESELKRLAIGWPCENPGNLERADR